LLAELTSRLSNLAPAKATSKLVNMRIFNVLSMTSQPSGKRLERWSPALLLLLLLFRNSTADVLAARV
jgi:hypothetical protein